MNTQIQGLRNRINILENMVDRLIQVVGYEDYINSNYDDDYKPDTTIEDHLKNLSD